MMTYFEMFLNIGKSKSAWVQFLAESEGVAKVGLERVLLKTDYEAKAEDLIFELLCLKWVMKHSKNYRELKKEQLSRLEDRKCIAESLLMCKVGGVSVLGGRNTVKITANISSFLETKLEEKYKKYRLDYAPMSFEDGERCLKERLCDDVQSFVCNWYGWNDDAEWDWSDVSSDMVEDYILDNEVQVEITKEQIETKICDINREIKKWKRKGAPTKNEYLHVVVKIFSKFGLSNPSNEDHKIMFDCCDLLGFVDEELKVRWKKTKSQQPPEVSYMKSIWKQAVNVAKEWKTLYGD